MKYSKEIKNAIAKDYIGGLTKKELSGKYDVGVSTVANIITKVNKKIKENIRYCPHCGTALENPAMKFCWNCGQDVRSEEQLLLSYIKTLLSILSTFPSSQAEDGIQIALKLEEYLKKAEGRNT